MGQALSRKKKIKAEGHDVCALLFCLFTISSVDSQKNIPTFTNCVFIHDCVVDVLEEAWYIYYVEKSKTQDFTGGLHNDQLTTYHDTKDHFERVLCLYALRNGIRVEREKSKAFAHGIVFADQYLQRIRSTSVLLEDNRNGGVRANGGGRYDRRHYEEKLFRGRANGD